MTTFIDWGGDENQLPDGDDDPFGRDLDGTNVEVIKQALYRRFTTEAGSLFYDATYGENVLSFLSDASTPKGREQLKTRLNRQALADERIDSADVTVDYDDATETLTIQIDCIGALGPFSLVMRADQAGVRLVGNQSG